MSDCRQRDIILLLAVVVVKASFHINHYSILHTQQAPQPIITPSSVKRHVASAPELTLEEARREAEEAAARQREYELKMMQESGVMTDEEIGSTESH